MYFRTNPAVHNNPFGQRPWLKDNGAAAPAGGGNMGLKGIIAGNHQYSFLFYFAL